MIDRDLARRLLELGIVAFREDRTNYADPSADAVLRSVSTAAIANCLEELGGHGLIGDVQPQFTPNGAGFRYQVTDKAAQLVSDARRFEQLFREGMIRVPRSALVGDM